MHNGVDISGNYQGPGQTPDGSDFFYVGLENTAYLGEQQPGYTHAYVYHPDQRSSYGDHWYPDGTVLPGTATPGNFGSDFVARPQHLPETGEWYSVEFMVDLNTPGSSDGRIAAWIDGELIADWGNVQFRDTADLKIDRVQLNLGAESNTDGADRQWFDNLVIATEYIGPLADGSGEPVTPELVLSIAPDTISENGGVATGTVTRSGPTTDNLVVALSSDDTGEATVPASVTIDSGASSATFTVRGVDDTVVDGTQEVTLSATASGATAATTTIGVTDNDVPKTPTSSLDGTPGPDSIFGTSGPDLIQALGGPDFIDAEGGDDVVLGGPGRDEILGRAGKDILYGGGDNDTIKGNGSLDILVGGPGDDRLVGGGGLDTAVFAGAFADHQIAGSGTNRTVEDQAGDGGRDTLRSVELLQFDDGVFDARDGSFDEGGFATTAVETLVTGPSFSTDPEPLLTPVG